MTKEEAIFCEKSYIGKTNCADCNYYGTDTCQSRVSHKMAIKALEQEPCEDAVSRKFMYELGATCIATRDKNGKLIALGAIENLPPVTPTRKKGKWIDGSPTCPCCGEDKFKDLDADIWSDWQPKFCPNCGAEMESEK